MDNRQHGLKNSDYKQQGRFWKFINKFFGVEEKKKTLQPEIKSLKFWKQGGGFGFGKPAWMRSKRILEQIRGQK